jgi:hypothetical protein
MASMAAPFFPFPYLSCSSSPSLYLLAASAARFLVAQAVMARVLGSHGDGRSRGRSRGRLSSSESPLEAVVRTGHPVGVGVSPLDTQVPYLRQAPQG